MKKQLVCSVSIKDMEIQTFCAGGPGGQKQNKTASAVRLIHHASGARGESREHKSQMQNKKAAFKRLSQTKEFMRWARKQAGIDMLSEEQLQKRVDRLMQTDYLKVEFQEQGTWQKEQKEE